MLALDVPVVPRNLSSLSFNYKLIQEPMPMLSERAKTGYERKMVDGAIRTSSLVCQNASRSCPDTHSHIHTKNKYGKSSKNKIKYVQYLLMGKSMKLNGPHFFLLLFFAGLFLLHLIQYSMRCLVRVTQMDESNRFLFRSVHFLLCWLNKIV